MFEYEFDGNRLTKKNVEDRAAEKGLSLKAYLAVNPQITKINIEEQEDITTQDETAAPVELDPDNNLLVQVALESPVDLTSWIDKSFFDYTEDEAVSQLQTALEGNQRMGLANFVEIEAPNGEKLLIETAISSSSALVLKKKGKEGLEKYYADLESDLRNFIEINSDFSVEAKLKK